MKRKIKNTIIHFILINLIVSYGIIAQQIQKSELPKTIAFNGKLTDKSGKIFEDDLYNFTFFIYSNSDQSNPIWSEVHQNVLVKNGEFNVVLGDGSKPNPLPFIDGNYSLGIKVNDENEMLDKFHFTSVPYSLGANFAESVSDNSITTDKIAKGAITDAKIKNININKITNLPSSIGSWENLRALPQIKGSDYDWWTLQGNIIFGPERHYLGVQNDRDFLIRSWEIQRMLFTPFGYVVIGTTDHNVRFEVIGKSTFTDDAYIKGVLGVGIYPTSAKMHINNVKAYSSLKVDFQNNNLFEIEGNGRTTIRSSVTGSDGDQNNYPLFIDAQTQGIAIRVDGNASGDNNYMSFWTENNLLAPTPTLSLSGISNIGNMAGRIEGQNAADYWSDLPNIIHATYIAALIVAEVMAIGAASEEAADIISIGADLAENAIIEAKNMVDLGVTYESGSGDYAEWIEKVDKNEKMFSGDIVGVKGGKISKNTEDAEFIMAISSAPIVLGNSPMNENTENFEKVAFMGQIPISVRGVVNEGDFIIPSGLKDGTGFAISPELLTIDEYPNIVGQAWSSSSSRGITLINTHVGLDNKDIGYIIKSLDFDEKRILSGMQNFDDNLCNAKSDFENLRNKFKSSKNSFSEILIKFEKEQIYLPSTVKVSKK